jgi:hypothetical protein
MEVDYFKYVDERLWVYRNSVYRPEGEKTVRTLAQRLPGEERQEKHITETLGYIETATQAMREKPGPRSINLKNGRLNIPACVLEPHIPDLLRSLRFRSSMTQRQPAPSLIIRAMHFALVATTSCGTWHGCRRQAHRSARPLGHPTSRPPEISMFTPMTNRLIAAPRSSDRPSVSVAAKEEAILAG